MDGKGNNRGAYAQVTAPIGDDPKVTIQQGGKSGAAHSFCTPKRLICAVVTAIAIIILIVIIVVLSTKNTKTDPDSVLKGNSTATVASSVNPEMAPTQQPTMKTTTFGPAVIGSFDGTFVMDIAYGTYYDDVRAPATVAFTNNFTGAMNEVYNVPSAAKYMYDATLVNQLVKNGTNLQVRFTVSLNAINRGGRDYLVTYLGSFPSNALNTDAVLYADIGPEIDPSVPN